MGIETERKFIIKMPDFSLLSGMDGYTKSEIEQVYLKSENSTRRIRKRVFSDKILYTETEKIRINSLSAVENEREISDNEFSKLKAFIRNGSAPIKKTRYTVKSKEILLEIDVYPQWKNTAIMEIELQDENQAVEIPSFIQVLREVTGNKLYSNSSLSMNFPKEDL